MRGGDTRHRFLKLKVANRRQYNMDWSGMTDFGNANRTKETVVLVVAFVIASAAVSIFNHFFYTSQALDDEAQEIGSLINEGGEFDQVARALLNTRTDLVYLKLLGENGEIRESFGNDDGEDIKRFRLSLNGDQTVMFGLKDIQDRNTLLRPLVWSVVIGLIFSGICGFAVLLVSDTQSAHLEKLGNAIKRVSRGDLTAKLSMDKSVEKDPAMIRLFEGFNQMVDQIKRRGDISVDSGRSQPVPTGSPQPALADKEETRQKKITSFVAKISDFEELSETLNPGDLTSFLAEYRKTASSVISGCGGVIESLLQDEIVALFNTPEEQDKPELKAVCAGVQLLQVLAGMNTKRKIEGKRIISGKVGIEVKVMPFYGDSDAAQGVDGIVHLARRISDDAPSWNILVSSDLYDSVSKYVDVKEVPTENGTLFSIIAVDEEVAQA